MCNKYFCPICGENCFEFLTQKRVPVYQNGLYNDFNAAINCIRGTLNLCHCLQCDFIFNSEYDSTLCNYSQNYDNNQNYSTIFSKYIDRQIAWLCKQIKLNDINVIEIGCGKGYYLDKLSNKSVNCTLTGYDPSFSDDIENFESKGITVFKELFGQNQTDIVPDLIICRHVIEHIQQPVKFLKSIYETAKKNPGCKIFFETPDVNWILENNCWFDLFYEHCSYFNANSITTALNISGFSESQVIKEFNGQYMWIIAELQNDICINKKSNIKTDDFTLSYNRYILEWCNKVKSNHDTAVWGAGAKGVTFLNLLDPEKKLIRCVIDINENKQGKYLSGTGHKIISPDELSENNIQNIIILNPNYTDEIKRMLKSINKNINIL